MYLGKFKESYQAKDNNTIFAAGAPSAEAVGVAPVAVAMTDNTPVAQTDKERIAELETALAKATADTNHQRGRVKRLLNVLRGNKRTIARLERELAARTGDQLTVDDILASHREDAMN